QCDRDRTRQTDLTAVGMPAQQQVESSVGGLAINPRSVRQQNRKAIGWNVLSCLLDVIDPIKVRVIDTGQINIVAASRDWLALIEQNPNPHVLRDPEPCESYRGCPTPH